MKELLTISLASRRVLDKLSARFGRDNPPSAKAEKYFMLQLLKTFMLHDRKSKPHSLSATLCFSKFGNSYCWMSTIKTYFHISFPISYTSTITLQHHMVLRQDKSQLFSKLISWQKSRLDIFFFNKQQHFVQCREKEQQSLVNFHKLQINACSFIRISNNSNSDFHSWLPAAGSGWP